MELEKFITQSFKDIINGVNNAQNELKETGVIINAFDKVKLRNINFDIATVSEKTREGKGEVSGKIMVVGLDLGGKISKSDSIISRISFTVPVVLPNPVKVSKSEEQ